MEASAQPRPIEGEKAQRIVEAMRASVGRRGVAASTFDNVAREAGVSRGLLHYYFGTKERLLGEVVRRDCDVRMEHARPAAGDGQHGRRLRRDARYVARQMRRRGPRLPPARSSSCSRCRGATRTSRRSSPSCCAARATTSPALLEAKEAEGVLHLRADAERDRRRAVLARRRPRHADHRRPGARLRADDRRGRPGRPRAARRPLITPLRRGCDAVHTHLPRLRAQFGWPASQPQKGARKGTSMQGLMLRLDALLRRRHRVVLDRVGRDPRREHPVRPAPVRSSDRWRLHRPRLAVRRRRAGRRARLRGAPSAPSSAPS